MQRTLDKIGSVASIRDLMVDVVTLDTTST
jgi:hypothetical protein